MTNPIVSLSAAAVLDVDTHHATHGTVYDTLTNRGQTAVRVTVKVANLNASSHAHPAAAWVSLPKASFTVAPGSAVRVPVVLSVPPNAVGETQVTFTAAPVAKGTLKVSGAVATSVEINKPPQVADAAARNIKLAKAQASAGVHSSNGLAVAPGTSGIGSVAILTVAAVVLVAAAVVITRRFTSRGAHR